MKSIYAIGSAVLLAGAAVAETDAVFDAVEQQFRALPIAARQLTGPLFWMHGDETKAQLEGELQKVLEGGNGIFTAEPRPHKDWLGEGWYRDLGICLDFARKNNLKMIIYDDWWWPSQMMGGRVPPQYGSKRIEASATNVVGPVQFTGTGYGVSNLIAVIAGHVVEGDAMDGGSLVDLAQTVKDGCLSWQMPTGTWKIMTFSWRFTGDRGGQQRMISVDGASPDCVDWFIKTVYQPHYDRFKEDFGKTIVGYFYDEPETQGDWGSDVPVLIAERKLDLAKLLVGYKFKLAGEEQTAAFHTYLNVFAESWGRTMYGGMSRWCKEHNVYSMGHFMEHNDDIFSRNLSAGDMMQLQKYSDMGGMDLVCSQLYPGNRPMGMYQMPKIASSISHVYNKADDVAFCEIYGGYGQRLTYPQMKWLADWHHVRGVNFLIPHSFNPRAPYDGDYPPYFYNGGFEPRWPLYRVWADYTSRLSLMLTGGRHVCPIAFLHIGQSIHSGRAIRPEELTSTLQDALYDCDWLPYDAFEHDATLSGKDIVLHKEHYQVLIVPPVEVIPYAALAKARQFFDQGGVVIGYGFLPTKSATLGKRSDDVAGLCQAIWGDAPAYGTAACKTNAHGGRSYFLPKKPTVQQVRAALADDAKIEPVMRLCEGPDDSWLHVLHRVKAGRDVFFIANQQHAGNAKTLKLRLAAAGEPECWDPMRNEITAVPFARIDSRTVELTLTLEPSESVLVVFQDRKRNLPQRISGAMKPQHEIPVEPTMKPSTADKPLVLKATYGVPGDAKRTRDVRGHLQKLIDAGQLQIPVSSLTQDDDPAHGVVKTLQAECRIGTNLFVVKGVDTQVVSLTGDSTRSANNGRPFTTSPVLANPFVGQCILTGVTQSQVYLEMDGIAPEEATRVTVNGHYAGGMIGKPFRLDITKYIKAETNMFRLEPFAPTSVRLSVYKD